MKLMMPCKPSELIIIWWWDAVSSRTQLADEPTNKLRLAINHNIGWITHENKKRVVLCSGGSDTGEVESFLIPIANIIKRKRLYRKK